MYEESTVKNEAALQALYGDINPNSLAKEMSYLTPAYRAWIERAPFMTMATIGPGGMDCSPRGDKPGQLFRILDDNTIAIPDRRGNNRLDTLKNLVVDPRVALLFLLPGINESLRINGKALVVTDTELRESFAVGEKMPISIVIITIESVYFQCGRALLRSSLWSADAQVPKNAVPSAGEMIKAGAPDFDATSYDEQAPVKQQDTMY